jgi:putative membrane-bound dehydrogenase-like protein
MRIIKFFSLILLLSFFSCKSNNQKQASSGKTELDGLKVPEGYSISRIVDPKLLSFPMLAIFDNTGRIFVFESDGSTPTTEEMLKHPTYHVRLLQDTNNDGIYDKSNIFADSLTVPKGGVFYKGSLYVTATPDLFKITDTDNDGVGDKREVVHTGWKLDHNAAVLGGPFFGPDGWMYLTDARRGFDITTKEGKHLSGKSARIWRYRPDGTGLEPILGGGYDNTIEIIFMPGGETIGTMTYFTDPQGGERDALMHWLEGGVYPKPHNVIEEDKFKLTGELMPVMTKLARVAPSGLMRYRSAALGNEFKGNLFSAEFNTGRIMRSVISPEGATFKTSDEPFITSTLPDVHPTDVFEDADGSMIVVNTGGWFIAGCPLSRVAKLDVPGGIYRVKKNDAAKVDDPWGKNIDWEKLSADELAILIRDKRIFVRDNAIERLVDKKDEARSAVQKNLLTFHDEEVQVAGVFILGRIGALGELHNALNDPNPILKVAAARMLGLAKDTDAVERLKQLLLENNLAVRRQAAIALEQIGDTSAVDALLKAAAEKNDRYAEHSIIHALIMLKKSAPLLAALNKSSASARKAAIIALDQMDGYKIQKQSIVPFLESDNQELVNTGMWVTSHHKDWGDAVVQFLGKVKDDNDKIYSLLTTFSGDPLVQQYISTKLSDPAYSLQKKKALFGVMINSRIKKISSGWLSVLRKLLKSDNTELRSMVLAVVQSRGIKEMTPQVQEIVMGDGSAEMKLKALSARTTLDPLLTAKEFGIVLRLLDSSNQAPVRQQASRILSSAELSSAQLIALAKQIPSTDNYLLPNIINCFENSINEGAGVALVSALSKSQDKLDNISEDDLNKVLKGFPSSVKKTAAPVINIVKQKNADRLSQLQSAEASLKKGNVGDGRKLFFGKAICSTCHSIANEGNKFAPDLTNIGEIRSQHDILEAILFPSASFAREYETSRIVTKTNTYNGIIKEQYPEAIVIETGPGASVRIQRTEINSIEPGTLSLMPPGLDKQLTPQELSDLVAYLVSLPDGASGTIGY